MTICCSRISTNTNKTFHVIIVKSLNLNYYEDIKNIGIHLKTEIVLKLKITV